MNIQIEKKEPDLDIFRISGRIDASKSGQLEQELNKSLSTGSLRMIVNLADVTLISSSGLRVFLSVLKNVKSRNGDMKICCLDSNVERTFQIAGFLSLFDILPTEEDAVRKFG